MGRVWSTGLWGSRGRDGVGLGVVTLVLHTKGVQTRRVKGNLVGEGDTVRPGNYTSEGPDPRQES